jgi:hypothetical protein
MVLGQGACIHESAGLEHVQNPSHSTYKQMVSVADAELSETEDSLYE